MSLQHTGDQFSSNVGSYAITGSGLSANFGNYLFAQAPANATALTINTGDTDGHRRHRRPDLRPGNPLLSGSVTGFVGNDTLASATTGTAIFSTPATSSSNVGSYTITGSGLSAKHGNYLFAQAPANATALTIAPATLTVTANAVDRIYGQANPLLSGSITGFVGSDTLASATTGTMAFSTPATSSSNVGSYAVIGSGLSANFGNYLFAQAPANATALTIAPATLTVTANAVDRIYGQANPLLSGSISGFVGSDTLASATTGTETFSTSATSTSNVGSYAVIGSGLSANFGNYLFAQAPANASALTITPATLTVTADAVDRIYGQANPLLSGSITGFVGSDTLASATTGTMAFSTPATSRSNVGSYTITGWGLSANHGNYLFAQAPANATALTITPATLTYTATPASFTTGQTPSGLSGTVSGFVPGDGLAGSTTGTLAWLTPAGSSSPAGQYAINGSGLIATNYLFEQAAGNATALTLNAVTPIEAATHPQPSNASNSSNSSNPSNASNSPPPTPAASNVLATTQLLTNILASLQSVEPETPDLSSTITVKEISGTPSAEERTTPSASNQVDVLTNIHGIGPTLYIVNGGTRLPANPVAGN
jgi:type IV secretory pathway protease TraF